MKSSEHVHELGLYVSDCCETELVFGVSDHFSRCPSCLHLCRWELQEELVFIADLVTGNAAA